MYVGVRISTRQYDFLMNLSKTNNLKVSAIIRKAIDEYMNNYSVEVYQIQPKLDRINDKLDVIIHVLGESNAASSN